MINLIKPILLTVVSLVLSGFLLSSFAADSSPSAAAVVSNYASGASLKVSSEPAGAYPVDQNGTAYKVNHNMGKTCWIAADEPPARICGPAKQCGDGLPEPSSCYIINQVPNCCTYCPSQHSSEC